MSEEIKATSEGTMAISGDKYRNNNGDNSEIKAISGGQRCQ
jgi:hypothetical protein